MKEVALVTGGSGFIGGRLIARLLELGSTVCVLTRDARHLRQWAGDRRVIPVVGDLVETYKLSFSVGKIDSVFHLAGIAHTLDRGPWARSRHWQTSVDGTNAVLHAVCNAGAQRFVYVSSTKVMGEGGDQCLDETSPTPPETAYGEARRFAEDRILEVGRRSGMHVSILRLPLVYGSGSKGNIPAMIQAVDRRWFPPFPDVSNKRSMVHVDDVVEALLLAVSKSSANGQLYIVTDKRTYSTRYIYEAICRALGREVPNWSVPIWMMRLGAGAGDLLTRISGRDIPFNSETLKKLLGSAWYSSEKISRQLGYRPTKTFADALPGMVAEYKRKLQTKVEGTASK